MSNTTATAPPPRLLTHEEACAVYHVLARDCGAGLQAFVDFVTEPSAWREYRFQGSLGFGGKFYADRDGWRVTCYRENETPARLKMIQNANAALAELFKAAR